jgi:hypothetical protein
LEHIEGVLVIQSLDTLLFRLGSYDRVEIGARIGDRQEIRSGLSAGAPVVIEGGLFLSKEGAS